MSSVQYKTKRDCFIIEELMQPTSNDESECPDPYDNPDDCAVCEGWGHRCSVFRVLHTFDVIDRIEQDSRVWDPRRFYTTDPAGALTDTIAN